MKVLLIGHTGTLGKILFEGFSRLSEVELVTASRHSGDFQVAIDEVSSVEALFAAVGQVDAIVSAAGSTVFKPFTDLAPADIQQSIASKLQGQVNLALIGHPYVTDGGSITLTSGIIKEAFIPEGTSSALVNGAIESFVASAAFEIDRGIRINAVSPNALVGSWDAYAPSFRGFIPVGDASVFAAYEKSVFGIMTGQTFKVW